MYKKGFTVVELLVTLFIIGIVLSAAYISYIYLLKGFKKETQNVETQMENLIGLEIIRLDLEHLGYGISDDETSKIIEWQTSPSQMLILRETLNNTNESTFGYVIAKCESGNLNIQLDRREDTTNNYVSIINIEDKTFFTKGTINGTVINISPLTCTNNKLYMGFPIRQEVHSESSNGCSTGYCEQITYLLSDNNLIDRCNGNTYNLLRRVGTSDKGGEPVLSCVADFQVRFDIDDDGNGYISSSEENKATPPANNSDIKDKLKKVNVYILVQEGKYDPDFNFSSDYCNNSAKKCTIDEVDLKLPNDFNHYRWKILKLSAKPMDL